MRVLFPRDVRSYLLPAVGAGLLLAFSCKTQTSTTTNTPVLSHAPRTGLPMPAPAAANANIGWTIANIKHVRLADSRNKVVILDFYATWCEPCRESIPHLIDLHKRYAAQGLEIVGLNVGGEDDYEKVPAFAREFHIPYQLGVPDPEMETLYISDEAAIPQTFVLDRHGAIVKRFVGYDESLNEELESAVQASLAETK